MLPSLVDVAGTISSICLLTVISYLTGLYQPALICILIQWAVAIFQAIPQQRETYYDVTGSVTFAIVSLQSVLLSKVRDWHSILLSILVWIWCVRLGTYLFQRIRRSGQDARFATIRSNPVLFSLRGVCKVFGCLTRCYQYCYRISAELRFPMEQNRFNGPMS